MISVTAADKRKAALVEIPKFSHRGEFKSKVPLLPVRPNSVTPERMNLPCCRFILFILAFERAKVVKEPK